MKFEQLLLAPTFLPYFEELERFHRYRRALNQKHNHENIFVFGSEHFYSCKLLNALWFGLDL